MKKNSILVSFVAGSMLLAGCSSEETFQEPTSQVEEASQSIPDFNAVTKAGADVSDQLPPEGALSCTSRAIQTSDGAVTLKNFLLDGNEANFYFAPKHSPYNSYSYRIDFENGMMVMRDDSAGSFESFVLISGSTEKVPVSVPLGGGYIGASFEVPTEFVDRLGALRFAAAAINGEHAGSCSA